MCINYRKKLGFTSESRQDETEYEEICNHHGSNTSSETKVTMRTEALQGFMGILHFFQDMEQEFMSIFSRSERTDA